MKPPPGTDCRGLRGIVNITDGVESCSLGGEESGDATPPGLTEAFTPGPLVCCLAAVLLDQILDQPFWSHADLLWSQSSEGLREEARESQILPRRCLRPELQPVLHPRQYKSSPCKKVCVTGWMVLLPDDPSRLNIFQLTNPDKGLPDLLGGASRSPRSRLGFFFFLQVMFTSSRLDPGSPPSSGTKSWRRPAEAADPRWVHLRSSCWAPPPPSQSGHHSNSSLRRAAAFLLVGTFSRLMFDPAAANLLLLTDPTEPDDV